MRSVPGCPMPGQVRHGARLWRAQLTEDPAADHHVGRVLPPARQKYQSLTAVLATWPLTSNIFSTGAYLNLRPLGYERHDLKRYRHPQVAWPLPVISMNSIRRHKNDKRITARLG
jgi:hypothetical protein